MDKGFGNAPGPVETIDAIGDVILHLPRLPGEIAQRVGSAIQNMGSNMEAAVNSVTNRPDDVPPDPITFLAGVGDYILSGPKAAFEVIRGVGDGALETFTSAQARLKKLTQ